MKQGTLEQNAIISAEYSVTQLTKKLGNGTLALELDHEQLGAVQLLLKDHRISDTKRYIATLGHQKQLVFYCPNDRQWLIPGDQNVPSNAVCVPFRKVARVHSLVK